MLNGGLDPRSSAAWRAAESEIGAVFVPFVDHVPLVEPGPMGPTIIAAGNKDHIPGCDCTDPECVISKIEYKLMPLPDVNDMLRGLTRLGVFACVVLLRK